MKATPEPGLSIRISEVSWPSRARRVQGENLVYFNFLGVASDVRARHFLARYREQYIDVRERFAPKDNAAIASRSSPKMVATGEFESPTPSL